MIWKFTDTLCAQKESINKVCMYALGSDNDERQWEYSLFATSLVDSRKFLSTVGMKVNYMRFRFNPIKF